MGHTDPSPTPVHIRSLRSIYRVSCGLHHSAAIDGEEDFSLHNFFLFRCTKIVCEWVRSLVPSPSHAGFCLSAIEAMEKRLEWEGLGMRLSVTYMYMYMYTTWFYMYYTNRSVTTCRYYMCTTYYMYTTWYYMYTTWYYMYTTWYYM